MGTRADFYVGCGPRAVWLGSVAWDGYEWAEDRKCKLRKAKTAAQFREAVASILKHRDDATLPSQGWPWPWETSATTDYAYYFFGGRVCWKDRNDWPDMTAQQKVTMGSRSGLVVVTAL